MSFKIPANLRSMVLYWWKILDRPIIYKDDIYNFIAFELFLTSLSKTKTMVKQAVNLGYLVEKKKEEAVILSEELKKDFLNWQKQGEKKTQKIKKILKKAWRPDREINIKQKYEVMEQDLVDVSVKERAGKLRSSSIQIENINFSNKISGKCRDKDDNGEEVFYPFSIDITHKKILHNCPDYMKLRKKQNKFCIHLSRLFMKLDAEDADKTLKIMENIAKNKESWVFSS